MNPRILGWSFTLLSVVVMWQLHLDNNLRLFVRELGAKQGSFLEQAMVDLSVPVLLTVGLLGVNWFYTKLFWRLLLGKNYLGGWWVYSLVAQTEEGLRDTLGYFHVRHSQDEVKVDEARAFWPDEEEQGLIHRGTWRSETVWFKAGKLELIYDMKGIKAEGLPTDYQGYLEVTRSHREPLLGRCAWEGSFNDLKERGRIKGPVYAERLVARWRWHPDKVKKLLVSDGSDLLQRVCEFLPPPVPISRRPATSRL